MNLYRYRIVKKDITMFDGNVRTRYIVERSILGIMWSEWWDSWTNIHRIHSFPTLEKAMRKYQQVTHKKNVKKTIVHP